MVHTRKSDPDPDGRLVRRTVYAPPSSLSDDLQVLSAMWWHGPRNEGSHQEQLESFYERQAHLYDQYRHRMLHGRKPMMLNMPAPAGGVWVDLGGGTGANMEYFREGDALRRFGKVYLVRRRAWGATGARGGGGSPAGRG